MKSRLTLLLLVCALPLDAAGDGGNSRWRGSFAALRTEISLLTFDKSAEMTYNPYTALAFEARPRFYFYGPLRVDINFSLLREFTKADDTTRDGETWLGDLLLGFGADRFWTVPYLGIDVSADLKLHAPTSKVSRARTMLIALSGGLNLSKRFDLLSGMTVAYGIAATGYWYRYTTAETEAPLISGCAPGDAACDRFQNTGVRNPMARLANMASINQAFLPWLDLTIAVGYRLDFLHAAQDSDARISYVPVEPTDRRHSLSYQMEVGFLPMKSLGIGLGLAGTNPLQAPDSTPYRPLVNRYTLAYVEMRLLFDGLLSQLEAKL